MKGHGTDLGCDVDEDGSGAQEETDLRGLGKQMSVRLKEKEDTGPQDVPPLLRQRALGKKQMAMGQLSRWPWTLSAVPARQPRSW